MKKKIYQALVASMISLFLLGIGGCGIGIAPEVKNSSQEIMENSDSEQAYQEVNGGQPQFPRENLTTRAYENYSPLDSLGRCGVAEACIGKEIMPTEERGSIGQVKPSGWHTVKYDNVDGKYLYNRCHLIGFQLAGENANERNLITGTRYMNTEGMLPFENAVADYVKETGNHVMYRVTPDFQGNDLVASGVQMEAMSVEDQGEGVSFNVYVYNRQPGISIDYLTGESRLEKGDTAQDVETSQANTVTYIINKNTKKFHRPDCSSVEDTKLQNRKETSKSKAELLEEGYQPCQRCIKER